MRALKAKFARVRSEAGGRKLHLVAKRRECWLLYKRVAGYRAELRSLGQDPAESSEEGFMD